MRSSLSCRCDESFDVICGKQHAKLETPLSMQETSRPPLPFAYGIGRVGHSWKALGLRVL